jgi:hypothetical protein
MSAVTCPQFSGNILIGYNFSLIFGRAHRRCLPFRFGYPYRFGITIDDKPQDLFFVMPVAVSMLQLVSGHLVLPSCMAGDIRWREDRMYAMHHAAGHVVQ